MRIYPVLAVPLIGVAILSGCAAPHSAPSSSTAGSSVPTSAPATTPAQTSTPAQTPTPGASASTDPNAPAGQCADDALAVAVTGGDAGAGSLNYLVRFTNTSSAACALEGAPGVSIVGKNDGTQVGVAATRGSTGGSSVVSLAPGGAASAALKVVNIGTDGGPIGSSCKATTGDGYRIYPPHSYVAVFVPLAAVPACASSVSWMTIGPVHAGS
jgi:Protein of unknown function (DUF4232)